jgi:hypothetical protein
LLAKIQAKKELNQNLSLIGIAQREQSSILLVELVIGLILLHVKHNQMIFLFGMFFKLLVHFFLFKFKQIDKYRI